MKLEEIKNISVLGAGIMGHGIAQSFLMGGYPVMLYDIQESILETARTHIKNNLELFHQAGLISAGDIDGAIIEMVGAYPGLESAELNRSGFPVFLSHSSSAVHVLVNV